MKQSKRARALAKRPDVAAWVAELNRVMQSAPPGLWLFADSGNLAVMALDADGHRAVDRHGGMDQREMVASVDFGERRLMTGGSIEAWVQAYARAAYELPEVVAVYAGRFGTLAPSVTVAVAKHTPRAHKRAMAVGSRDNVRALQPLVCCTMVCAEEHAPQGQRLIGRRP